MDQTKKVKNKKNRSLSSQFRSASQKSSDISTNSGGHLKNLAIFYEFWGKQQKKKIFILKSLPMFPRILVVIFISKVKTKKKTEKFFVPKSTKSESTKITKKQFLLTNSRAISTILRVSGLDLHSSCPEPLISSGHSPRLGGHGPECPPVAPGL